MTTSDKLIEFARLYCSALYYKDHCASGSATLVTNEEQMLSDLTALISEGYVEKAAYIALENTLARTEAALLRAREQNPFPNRPNPRDVNPYDSKAIKRSRKR